MSTCRGCGAPVLWATTPAGKAQPLDAKPEKRIVLEGPDADKPIARVVDTYLPHHATCPEVAKFRKPKETSSGS